MFRHQKGQRNAGKASKEKDQMTTAVPLVATISMELD